MFTFLNDTFFDQNFPNFINQSLFKFLKTILIQFFSSYEIFKLILDYLHYSLGIAISWTWSFGNLI